MYTYHPATSNVSLLHNRGVFIKEIKIGITLLTKPQTFSDFTSSSTYILLLFQNLIQTTMLHLGQLIFNHSFNTLRAQPTFSPRWGSVPRLMPGAHGLCTVTIITVLILGSSPHVAQSTSYIPHVILPTIVYVGYHDSHVTDEETELWTDSLRSHTSGKGQR